MGQPPRCTRTPSKSKPEQFDQAERVAFQHVGQALRDMPFCSLPDLEQAAFSYLCESLRGSGVAVREEYARRKAATWAAWWNQKHRDQQNATTAHQVHASASGARATSGLDPEEGRDGLDGLEGPACAGSRRQAGRDRGGTRVQPSHGVQTEQAAISPDRRGGLVLLLRVDTR